MISMQTLFSVQVTAYSTLEITPPWVHLAMEVSCHCPICWDIYDDAVLAKDGFSYCRTCIVEWAETHAGMKWPSPMTMEMFGGHPVLRTDIERNCAARERRREKLLASLEEVDVSAPKVLEALEASHAGKPLLGESHCLRILEKNHCSLYESPYVFLTVAYRGRCLDAFPLEQLKQVLHLDRRGVCVPLLKISVIRDLLEHYCRKLREASSEEGLPEILQLLKDHIFWRARCVDAVEVPLDRALEKGRDKQELAGIYYRDWSDLDESALVFINGNGTEATRKYLIVPLQSDTQRGSYEKQLSTRIALSRDEAILSGFSMTFQSEEELPVDASLWRSRRGGLPFPDSRGSSDSEEETWETPVLEGCGALFERPPSRLPHGFKYHVRLSCMEHVHELNQVRLEVLDAVTNSSCHPVKKQRR